MPLGRIQEKGQKIDFSKLRLTPMMKPSGIQTSTPQTTNQKTSDIFTALDPAAIPGRIVAKSMGLPISKVGSSFEIAASAVEPIVGKRLAPFVGGIGSIIGDPTNLIGGPEKAGVKGAMLLSKIHPEDVKFLSAFSSFVKEGKNASEKAWQRVQDVFRHYELEVPTTQKKAADFLETSFKSTETRGRLQVEQAFNKEMDAKAVVPATVNPSKVSLTKPVQPRAPNGWWERFKAAASDERGFVRNPFFKEEGAAKGVPETPLPPQSARPVESLADSTKKVEPSKRVERGFISSAKEYDPELGARVAGQYVPRSTDRLAMKAATLVTENIDAAESLARTGTSDKAVATASELIKHYTTKAIGAGDQATRNTLFDKAADVANTIARTLTEQGRAVQAASILGRLTPEGVVRFAAREIQKFNEGIDVAKNTLGGLNPTAMRNKIPELTGAQIESLTKKAKEIESMPDGVPKAQAWHKLNEEIATLVPSSLYKKLVTVWKAGLLTGVKTSGLNIASNLFHGVSEMAKDIPAAAVDSVASLFTGERTLALTGKGAREGVTDGFSKGLRYFKTGFDERDIGTKLDYKQVNFGSNKFAKAIQAYEETIFRVIGAEDQPFYYGAKAHSMMSQAIAMAKNKGIKGTEAKTFIENLVQNPTDDMLKYATLDAETAVFQQSTALGKIAKGIQNLPGGEIAVPFGKTPAGVATQLLNYSPIGFIKTFAENIGKGRFDQRLFSQGIGRATVGTGIAYLGTRLFDKDMISLGYPSSEKEREQWKLEGRTANSIKLFGKWRTVSVFGPAGLTLIAGGYYQQALKETGSHWQALAQAAAGGAKSITEQTFLKGVNQIVDAITNPERSAKNFVSGLIGSLIPTIVSDVARSTDQTERRTPGILDRAQSRIPGAREQLEPQVDVLGQENPTESFLETMADPTRPSSVSNDPLVLELKRLSEAGYQSTPTLLGDKEGYKALTPEQNTELWKRAGQLLKGKLDRLIEAPQYKEMDDEQRQKTIEQFTTQAKVNARAEMALQLTLDLEGQDLKAELSRLKAGGLLTKEVFTKYTEIR